MQYFGYQQYEVHCGRTVGVKMLRIVYLESVTDVAWHTDDGFETEQWNEGVEPS